MNTIEASETAVHDAIARAEMRDPELRRLRLAVDHAGNHLANASIANRKAMRRAYRSSMRKLLDHLAAIEKQAP